MLKLLLGHWKAHRRKPSLLPEDGDVHFEEPSTINPIFEDSDSSISSIQKPSDSKPQEQTLAESQVSKEQIKNANDVPIDNKLVDVSVPTHSKDSAISDINVPKAETTGVEGDENSLATETLSESKTLENSNPSKESETTVEDQNPICLEPASSDSILSKDEVQTEDTNSEEKMRIYNQPSTSAIRESKKHIDTIFDKKEKNPTPVLKSTDGQGAVTKENEQIRSFGHKASIPKNDETKHVSGISEHPKNDETKHVSGISEQVKESASATKSLTSNNLTQKSAKLKTRAIDELIKKFQGQTTETNDVASNTAKPQKTLHAEAQKTQSAITKTDNISSPSSSTGIRANAHEPVKKHSPNNFTKAEKLRKNISKSEIDNIHSLSTETNVTAIKTTKPKSEESSKTSKLEKKIEKPEESKQEIEALSNIFKFPPPPPLEKLANESSLHGKISKEFKPKSILSTSNNLGENADNQIENESGKTRSDSSLDRTRTVSSSKPKNETQKTAADDSKVNKIQEDSFKEPLQPSSKTPIQNTSPQRQTEKDIKKENESSIHAKSIAETVSKPTSKTETIEKDKKTIKTTELTSQSSNQETSAKETQASSQKNETGSNFLHKNSANNSNVQKDIPKSPVQVHKSSLSKASSKPYLSNENENGKSHSEDSGITRGDQISSEATQETPPVAQPEEASALPNSLRKSKKEKLKSANKKTCKHCKHVHNDSVSLKRSQYDEYYDGLTGVRRVHKNKHSDSWTSDLSFEEKELLRRLRSRRGTVRSNTPSTRSRHSRHRFLDESHFRRHHNFRRSLSDESSFYGASVCSCDTCWALYIKEQAYGRASLRGMSPIQMCTCRNSRQNFLGRRVQFRADTIPETSPSERTAATPAPPAEKEQDDDADDKSSQKSSNSKDRDSVSTHLDGTKGKNKVSEEVYRLVTPWELEEWDLLMRKHLLKKRRRRARCMGLMALSMVVFIGLIVTILMVYLRRKVI